MALNFTVSYTFSPSTTISSSQVNTNTSDVANVFIGLEAETKTLAKLKIDVDPTTALEVATKQYVDHYSNYRRPVLVYNSSTVVNIETGINGTSGQAQIQFPDGNLRQDSTTGRIQCNLAQVANLSGSWQSGLRTGTVAASTWYAVYAVKTTDDALKFVAVADLVLPLQANFTTLNTNFGTNGWVYLGLVRYGNNSDTGTGILTFKQNGNTTIFTNACGGTAPGIASFGTSVATSASTTSLTYTYSAGTGNAQIPNNIGMIQYQLNYNTVGATVCRASVAAAPPYYFDAAATAAAARIVVILPWKEAVTNVNAESSGTNSAVEITVYGFVDNVLGVGSNPLL